MTDNILRCAAFVALMVLAPPLAAHDPVAKATHAASLPAEARGAAATVDAFHAALRRGDTQSALALLADDVLILEGGGAERSKAEYASRHLAADAEFTKAVPTALTTRTGRRLGDLAWIASEGRIKGSFNGKAIDRVTAETMVLRRIGRQWLIVHIHWSSAANP